MKNAIHTMLSVALVFCLIGLALARGAPTDRKPSVAFVSTQSFDMGPIQSEVAVAQSQTNVEQIAMTRPAGNAEIPVHRYIGRVEAELYGRLARLGRRRV